MRGARFAHARDASNLVDDLREIAGAFARLKILGGRCEHFQRQDALRLKAGIDRDQSVKASQHQPRSDQKNERESDLGYYDSMPECAFRRGSDGGLPEGLVGMDSRNLE